MAREIVLPQWGMGMEEGTIIKWLKREGDKVEEGEPLAEIETSKISSEIEAPASGVLAYIIASEGETVRIGAVMAILADPGEKVERPTVAKPEPEVKPEPVSGAKVVTTRSEPGVQVTPTARRLARQWDVDLGQVEGTGPGGRITEADVRMVFEAPGSRPQVQVVPTARRLATEQGIDLHQVPGSGPGGRILVEDVERAVAAKAGSAGRGVPLSGIRKVIAERMLESVQTMAQVTLTTEADFTEAVLLMKELVSRWRARRLRPLPQDLVIMATARALKEHPKVNALLVDDEVRVLDEVNIGVATTTPDGLLVPVIKKAGEKSLDQIAQEVRELAGKTRDSRLLPKDLADASFTITNLGSYGVDAFTPIINPPQVAILGVGRIVEKPAVHQGEIAIRSMMALSLTFDHRALDGVPAAECLRAAKRYLEDPRWMVPS